MKKKKLLLESFSFLSVDPNYQAGWDDVWIKIYRGKKPLHLAPCFISRVNLLSDLETKRGLALRHPKMNFESTVEHYRVILERLQTERFVVDAEPVLQKGPGKDFIFASIYTCRDWLDKREVEEMAGFYVSKLGYSNFKYKWKRPNFFVNPITV